MWVIPVLAILGAAYLSLCVVFFFGQHLFFFRPEILPAHFNYQLPTYQYLGAAQCPVYILHGDRDYLISFKQSVMLQDLHPDKVVLIPIQGGWHNNLPQLPQYHEELYGILNRDVRHVYRVASDSN
jgi:fermentation-respiration switch protein FrsA (DUF1100 family)